MSDVQSRTRVYIDTHIVTLFKFLDSPDMFLPKGENEAFFIITSPVLRELERIKDEHFSKGQRGRARRCISHLESADLSNGIGITDKSYLLFKWQEPTEMELQHGGLSRPRTADEELIAAVYQVERYADRPSYERYVMSDDLGVRVRTEHLLKHIKELKSIKPPDLRHKQESFYLPRLVQAAVKELARELAAALREGEEK